MSKTFLRKKGLNAKFGQGSWGIIVRFLSSTQASRVSTGSVSTLLKANCLRILIITEIVASNPGLNVGGITPFTTIDFPGHLAAVLFCQGCPWRCRYCHNPHLLPMDVAGQHTWADILSWLETRKGLLEGIVLSGGEPLVQRHLVPSVTQLRDMGYVVALHTSGVAPKRFKEVLPLIDWVGLDVKAPFDEYDAITAGGVASGEHAKEVLEALLASGKPYELRCTLDPAFFTPERATKMANQLVGLGAGSLVIQECRDNEHRHSKPVAEAIRKAFEQVLSNVQYRS